MTRTREVIPHDGWRVTSDKYRARILNVVRDVVGLRHQHFDMFRRDVIDYGNRIVLALDDEDDSPVDHRDTSNVIAIQ